MKLLTAFLLCCASCMGQAVLVSSVEACSSFAGCALATPMNNTGATLLVVSVATYGSAPPVDGSWIITSPNAGTFTCINTSSANSYHPANGLCYILNPTVSSSQTVNCNSGGQVSCSAQSWSGVTGIITSTSNQNNSGSVQPGSITPSGSVLFLTTFSFSNNPVTACGIDSGFTAQACLNPSHLLITSIAYLNPSSSAQNPTWSATSTSTFGSASVMATFSTTTASVFNPSYIY